MVSPLGNRSDLERLRKRRQQRNLAKSAEEIAAQPFEVAPSTPLAQEATSSLNIRTPQPSSPIPRLPEKKQGIGGKVLTGLGYLGELGMGTVTSLLPSGGLLEEEADQQIKRGGVATTDPLYKMLRARRKELIGEGHSWASATRQAYIEARENKEFEVGIPLAGEILTDPTSYLGLGLVTKGVKLSAKTLGIGGKVAKEIVEETGEEVVKQSRKLLPNIEKLEKVIEGRLGEAQSGAIKNMLARVPYLGALGEKFSRTIRGNTAVVTGDLGKEVNKHFSRQAGTENKVSAVLGSLMPALTSTKLAKKIKDMGSGLGSRKSEADLLFPTNDIGKFNAKVKDVILDVDTMKNVSTKSVSTGEEVITKTGKTKIFKPGEVNPYAVNERKFIGAFKEGDQFIGNVFEKAFPVVKQGVKLDDFAKTYLDKLKLTDDSFKAKYGNIDRDAFGWLDLNVDDLRKISAYEFTGDQLQYVRNVWKAVDEMAEEMTNSGVKFERLAGTLGVGTKVVQRAYFPRTILFDGMNEATKKSYLKSKGLAPEDLQSMQKTRKYGSELDVQFDDAIERGDVTIGNSVEGLLGAYFRGGYKAIDDAKLDTAVLKLAKKDGTSVAFSIKAAERDELYSIVGKAIGAGKTNPQQISKYAKDLKELGHNKFAEDLLKEGGPAKIKKRLDDFEASESIDNLLFDTTTKEGRDLLKRTNDLIKTEPSKTFQFLGKSGDVLRVGKTGFDFGFALLQGLPILGSATAAGITGNLKKSADLYKTWGSSVSAGYKVFFKKESMEIFLKEASQKQITRADGTVTTLLNDFVENGGNLGKNATDIFAGVDVIRQTGARGIGRGLGLKRETIEKIGKAKSEVTTQTLGRFEDAFTHASDVLRIKGYEAMRATAIKKGDDGLRELTQFLNKATGALNPTEFGISPNQQAIERALLFFSPRYTRASFSMIADVGRGGLKGDLARESIFGMVGFGLGTYIALTEALGQEPTLDPTNSKFLTVKINEDRIGLGSFFVSFTKFAANMANYGTDAAGITEQDLFEQQRGNPIVNYLRGRTSPVTGIGIDLINGEDFLGRKFEGNIDRLKHVGKSALPFWMEASLLGDPYKAGRAGTLSEIAGLRTRPLNVWERRQDRRDELAVEKYGKMFQELNKVERDALVKNDSIIQEYDKLAKEISARGGDKMYEQIENFYADRDKIKASYKEQIMDAIDLVQKPGNIYTPREFRDAMKDANAKKRVLYNDLYERQKPGGNLELVKEYFDTMSTKYADETQPEDIVAERYLQLVVNNPEFDKPEGYDYIARDKAIQDFINEYGTELYEYSQQYISSGKDMFDLEAEYYNTRKNYEYYWEASEKAVFEAEKDPEYARKLREMYMNATPTAKIEMTNDEEIGYYIKRINNKISATKKELRKLNPGLDGFLYRFGLTDTLANKDNKDQEDFWLQSEKIELDVYKNGIAF